MKNLKLATIFLFILTSFITDFQKDDCDPNLSEPNKHQGFYIYVDAEPIGDYETLGEVKSVTGLSGQYQSVRSRLLKKAKKKYPSGDGIIIYFNNMGADKADVIKFKE